MKKMITMVVTLLLMFAPMALAFSVPEDVEVVSQPAYTPVCPETAPAVDQKMANDIAAIKSEVLKKDSKTAASIDALGNKIDDVSSQISGVASTINGKVDGLKVDLLDKDKGAFKEMKDNIWSAAKQTADASTMGHWLLFIAIVALGVFMFFCTRHLGNKVDKVPENVVNEVEERSALEDPIPLDVSGKSITFKATKLNGKYYGLKVSSNGETYVVRRVPECKGQVGKIIADYIANNNVHPNADQQAIIAREIANGNLVIV